MKKFTLSLTFALLLAITGCGQTDAPAAPEKNQNPAPEKPALLEMEDLDPDDGADLEYEAYDHVDSEYYGHPDFYNMKNSDRVTILEHYQPLQQTNGWSCGNNAVLSALNYFGIDKYTEWDLAVAMKSHTDMDEEGAMPGTANNWGEIGSSASNLMRFLKDCPEVTVVETSYKDSYTEDELVTEEDVANLEFAPSELGNAKPVFTTADLYTSDGKEAYVEDAKDSVFVQWLTGHLKAGRPIMIHSNFWNGHWVALIGYDNMGTPTIGDDMLIFADPYDTSDHWQDGYTFRPLEEFFYAQWQDLHVGAKPYQLQTYFVLEKNA